MGSFVSFDAERAQTDQTNTREIDSHIWIFCVQMRRPIASSLSKIFGVLFSRLCWSHRIHVCLTLFVCVANWTEFEIHKYLCVRIPSVRADFGSLCLLIINIGFQRKTYIFDSNHFICQYCFFLHILNIPFFSVSVDKLVYCACFVLVYVGFFSNFLIATQSTKESERTKNCSTNRSTHHRHRWEYNRNGNPENFKNKINYIRKESSSIKHFGELININHILLHKKK